MIKTRTIKVESVKNEEIITVIPTMKTITVAVMMTIIKIIIMIMIIKIGNRIKI